LEEGWGLSFIKRVYKAEFADGRDISGEQTLSGELEALSINQAAAIGRAQSAEIKAKLRANTEEARAAGIFGAPSFITRSGELFWGDDRLDQALAWSWR
jgi:2-hydroxychromene-2-carboxylate isomerase